MTTPERLRRRQLIEGAALILIGILMLVQNWVYDQRDDGQDLADQKQQECLVKNFKELSQALNVRGDLSARETKEVVEVITRVSQVQTEAELAEAFAAFNSEMKSIQKIRKDNPLPPYPPGTCDQ